jgi:hypothetical protein
MLKPMLIEVASRKITSKLVTHGQIHLPQAGTTKITKSTIKGQPQGAMIIANNQGRKVIIRIRPASD